MEPGRLVDVQLQVGQVEENSPQQPRMQTSMADQDRNL